jgi:hypothetical protein
MYVHCRGHSISTRNFQDLNTSIDDIHNLILINIKGRMLNFTCNLHVWVLTCGQENLTQSYLCESLSDFRNKFGFHLQKPKILSPSMCVILVVKDEFDACFRIVFASWSWSLDWVSLHKKNSFLLSF